MRRMKERLSITIRQRRAVSAARWREHFSDKLKNAFFFLYKIFPLPEEKNKDIIYHNYRNTACREMDLKVRKRQKKNRKKDGSGQRIRVSAVMLILSALLMAASAKLPAYAEWYSEKIYPLLVDTVGRMTGLLPFSAAEICLYLLLCGLAVSAVLAAAKIVKGGRAAAVLYAWFSKVILAVSVLALLYTVGCGINYRRSAFSTEEGIVTSVYGTDELEKICTWLTEEVNDRAEEVPRDGQGVMELSGPEGEGAAEAMEMLAEEFPSLGGYYPEPKEVIVSEILSFQGLTGVYSPFTVEANYNGDMTPYNIPFTVCHELSHLRGFMEEKEANFIAFLACIGSDRTDFQYSGYLSGWTYCMNALYRTDRETWQEVRGLLDERAETDVAANSEFWSSYEGVISETADRVNDTYLRVNGQAEGVKSYDRMVDLIVAYFRDKV